MEIALIKFTPRKINIEGHRPNFGIEGEKKKFFNGCPLLICMYPKEYSKEFQKRRTHLQRNSFCFN